MMLTDAFNRAKCYRRQLRELIAFFLFFCINVTPSNDLDKSTNERQSTPFWGVIFKCLAICLF